MEFHLTATGHHLPYGITQCYLPPDTSERTPPSPQPVGRYSIYLPRRDGRLSWPRLPSNAPAGNQTRDLSITSLTPYHYTNRATQCTILTGMLSLNKICHNMLYTLIVAVRIIEHYVNKVTANMAAGWVGRVTSHTAIWIANIHILAAW